MLMTINYCECCSNSWVESIIVLVTAEQKVLVWRSVDAFDSINIVTLHRARLVAGWVSAQNQAPRPTQPEPSLHE